MAYTNIADIVLRAGLAFAFLYPAINAVGDPNAWIGYFPQFTRGFVEDQFLLHLFGIVEVGIAFWLLSGWRVWIPALAATAMLLGIVIFNIPEFQVLFRDISIAAVGLALALMHLPRHTRSTD